MRPAVLALLLAALLFGACPPARAATAWSVAAADDGTGRSNFAYEANPGAVIEDAWAVSNTGDTPLELQVYATDAFTTPEGQLVLLAGDVAPSALGSWVRPEVDAVVLAPGEEREVNFTVSVPPDAAAGDHAGGIVSVLAPAGGGAVAVERRLGTRIVVHVGPSAPVWLAPAGGAVVVLVAVGLVALRRFSFKQAASPQVSATRAP